MAKGNEIVVSSNPKGVFLEGIMSGTPKPGVCMQIVPATEPVNGRFTWRVFTGADSEMALMAILLPDVLQGQLATTAYVTGTRCFMYCPAMGEDMNILLEDVSGTGDDHAIGDKLIVDSGTGKFLATTGTPESEPFMVLETITDPTADTLCWAKYLGV